TASAPRVSGSLPLSIGSKGPKGTAPPSLFNFQALPGTAREIEQVRIRFQDKFRSGTVRELRGAKATKAAFCAEAPGKQYLHVATHGFFAPPELRSALARDRELAGDQSMMVGLHPGLLVGLALAGSNQDEEGQWQRRPSMD